MSECDGSVFTESVSSLSLVGHTEAAVDLCKLAGKYPAAAISEVTSVSNEVTRLGARNEGDEEEIGGMARRDELVVLCREWGIKMTSIDALRKYRMDNQV